MRGRLPPREGVGHRRAPATLIAFGMAAVAVAAAHQDDCRKTDELGIAGRALRAWE